MPPKEAPKKTAARRSRRKAAPDGEVEAPVSRRRGEPRAPEPRPWSEVAASSATRARDAFRVAPELVSVQADPDLLPEVPAASDGLFELVSPVARRALDLGLATREPSFHVFVAAEPEVMIDDDIVRYAERVTRGRPTPDDVVYVHDFDHPEAPRPLLMPAGRGPELVDVMNELIVRLREAIPAMADAESVRKTQATLAAELEAKNKAVITELETTAKNLGFGVRAIQGGVQTFPVLHGKPVSAEQFAVLDESTKKALAEAEDRLTREVEKAAERVRAHTSRFDAAREKALADIAATVVGEAMNAVKQNFAGCSQDVQSYLDRVQRALSQDWHDLFEAEAEPSAGGEESGPERDGDPELATRLNRFKVNLLVSHQPGTPPPVVYDTNPTYPNLFGYLERRARFGALVTDFTRIRAGSLLRASGGVLVVRAADLLADPIIWERMKRVLRERHIGAEDPLGPLGLYATSLRPVPVSVRVRVVLVGRPELYTMLLDADADFASLFRVKVEVDPSIPRSDEAMVALDAYMMAMAAEREWGRFDRPARAKLLELATRLSGDKERVALFLSPLEETAAFASALAAARAAAVPTPPASRGRLADRESGESGGGRAAREAGDARAKAAVVTARDIEVAWQERRDRAGSAERHIRLVTLRGEVALDTSGTRVGVVNGLSVFSAGDVEFGQPMRITAVVALGREGIIDVEREAQLGGAIHTKGVAILRGYLSRMFGQERPLSLRAQIAFEQSYGEVEGDSASSSELFAVLSALADVPIDQGVAVTGSVNQLGEMQAIGGVCAKIEGFFDLCSARGLTGHQGALLPRANIPHLVLRDDVADAIRRGRFHLYAVHTAAQGLEVLTGIPAGERDATGRFPAWSVFGRVERRLIEIAERLREAEGHPPHDGGEGGLDDSSTTDVLEGGSARVR